MVTKFLIERSAHLRAANQDSHEGQGLVEYALVILLVAIGAVASVAALGGATVGQLWNPIRNLLIVALSA